MSKKFSNLWLLGKADVEAVDALFLQHVTWNVIQFNRHRQHLPAKVTKRIGCALKKNVFSRLDGAILLVEFLVRKSWSIFMSPFHERELL